MSQRRYTREAVERRRREHTERLQAEIDRILPLLSSRPDVLRVVVFGSVARGEVRETSDLDLVIVQDTELRFMDRLDEFYQLLLPSVDMDILVYAPGEWAALCRDRSFVRRVQSEGRVLYEKAER